MRAMTVVGPEIISTVAFHSKDGPIIWVITILS
jgi:hypothetical protein